MINNRPSCPIVKKMSMREIRKGVSKRATMVRQYSAGKKTMAENMEADCYTEGYMEKYDMTFLDFESLASDIYDAVEVVCPGATKTMKFLQDLATYELGSFQTFDAQGNKVTPTKKKKLHSEKQTLKKNPLPSEEEKARLEEIQTTLDSYTTKCVRGNGKRYMEWTTESGFHVLYEAYVLKKLRIRSSIPGFVKEGSEKKDSNQQQRIRHVIQEKNTRMPDIRKFQAGISANRTHSGDAAHLSSVIADWEGYVAPVHDSIGTHACDIEDIIHLTKKHFVEMYNKENYYEFLIEQMLSGADNGDLDMPTPGNLDITNVMKSKYFFC